MEDSLLVNLLNDLESDREERYLSEKRRFRNQSYDTQPISYAALQQLVRNVILHRTYGP